MKNQNTIGIAPIAMAAMLFLAASIYSTGLAYACGNNAQNPSCGCLKASDGACGCGSSCSCGGNDSAACSCGKASCDCGCKTRSPCICGKTSQATGNVIKSRNGFDSFWSFVRGLFGAKQ